MNSSQDQVDLITLISSIGLSYLAYRITAYLVPLLADDLVSKGLGGFDMLKPNYKRDEDLVPGSTAVSPAAASVMLPEATGVIAASVYILLLSLFAPLPYLSHLIPTLSQSTVTTFPALNLTSSPTATQTTSNILLDGSILFPHHSFASYLASLLSLLTATFLGFLDDVFDIRWRFKVPIPVIASVPLLVTYAAGHGVTDIVLPKLFGLRKMFNVESTNGVVHLGSLYYIYMSLLSTFCTNSINILAGVNGVEVGQALVIAISIALNDLLYISFDLSVFSSSSSSSDSWIVTAGLARGSSELADRHLFSLYFMLPLIGVSFGLIKHNWYPARAFIGDTYCYFSGMAFAVVGILGHFSKTLLLFFLPQIFNFVYSSPQLFGVLPCPRHRLPRFNASTGLLQPSYMVLNTRAKPLNRTVEIVLKGLDKLKLVKLQRGENGRVEGCTNLTILNLLLVLGGDMREDRLTMTMLGVQVMGSGIAFGIRYGGAGMFYDSSRR